MNHLVLLGDSIFDNRAYVAGGPAVIDQVQKTIPPDWKASLLAVDGNTAWFTIVTWPIEGASGRISMHRGTGSRVLANAAMAIANAVREPLYHALGLSA